MNQAIVIVRVFLGVALLLSLFGAGARVYRGLPAEGAEVIARGRGESQLTIVLSTESQLPGKAGDVAIELYPVDIRQLELEFAENPRPGRSFDDFLARRLKGKSVTAQLDQGGRATVKVFEGNWWVHARLLTGDGESAEWRLPIVVAGLKQTIELTKENAYERTRKF